MTPRAFHLHPVDDADPADRARLIAVNNRVWAEFAQTDAEYVHEAAQSGPARRWVVAARTSGDDVGYVQVERIRWNEDTAPPVAFLVLEEGLRSPDAYRELLEPCFDFARSLGAQELRVLAWEREVELVSLLLRDELGWVEAGRDVDVQLDVARTDIPTRKAPAEVEVVTLAARPELRRGVWETLVACAPDIPGDEPLSPPTFEQWQQEHASPVYREDAMFLAVVDGRVAGFAELELPELLLQQGVAWHGFTAVHPDFRGRGIPYVLKAATIDWARAHGVRWLRTENEARNAPMRHVNRVLGYEPAPVRLMMRGPVPPAS
ncbi:MAG: hypothetical protein JWO69_499 [Thermoleophilia bacterium]|jgi:GNAT superfamily N-acetyltransferase|nr:hypothetical protein [Thermoleophilia bacterium]